MRKKNGFTLVELLAVIVILAIIMIISIPAVLNTMQIAREKTFGEYVTKVYDVAEKKYLEQELTDGVEEYVRYDITKDIGLNNTGNYKGYVVFVRGTDKTDVYIGISDKDYHTVTQWGANESDRVNYINYTLGGEPKFTSDPEVFDGKKNYFMRGETSDFGLPSKQELLELVGGGTGGVLTALNESGFVSLSEESMTADQRFIQSSVTNSDFGTTGTQYRTYYTVQDIYGSSSSNKGYIAIHEEYYPDTPLGVPVKRRFSFIAFKDQNYHTYMQVKGLSKVKGNKIVTERFPMIQLNEILDNFNSLSFKKIETTPPTYDLTQGYKDLVISENYADAEASGDIQQMFTAFSNINQKLMNTQQYYCANTNSNCSFGEELDKKFYEDPTVLLGSYFDMNLDIDWSQF